MINFWSFWCFWFELWGFVLWVRFWWKTIHMCGSTLLCFWGANVLSPINACYFRNTLLRGRYLAHIFKLYFLWYPMGIIKLALHICWQNGYNLIDTLQIHIGIFSAHFTTWKCAPFIYLTEINEVTINPFFFFFFFSILWCRQGGDQSIGKI